MSVSLIHADARALPIADKTVDLVVTSPPYYALRSYEDGGVHYEGQIGEEPTPQEYVASLLAVTRECVRVLKPTGSLWVNLGDKYATYAGNRSGGRSSLQGATDRARPVVPRKNGLDVGGAVRSKSLMGIPWRYAIACIDDLNLVLRAEVIWSKPNGMPESVTDRVRRSHEQWFHFTLESQYFSSVDDIREPHLHGGKGATWEDRKAAGQAMRHGDTGGGASRGAPGPKAGNELGKLPDSVWHIATDGLSVPDELGTDHYAAFPMEFPRRIIQGWSPEDGIVLDPFGGTGTTALLADVLGRHGVSSDKSFDYCRIAEWRTADPGQRARAAQVAKPPAITIGQTALF